jgi:hypothetical protein
MSTKQQQIKKVVAAVKATVSKPVATQLIQEDSDEDDVVEIPITDVGLKQSSSSIEKKVKSVIEGGVKKPRQRQLAHKLVLSSRLSKEFSAPTRENSSVIGIKSINGTSASLRYDLLVAAQTYVDACVEMTDELAESCNDSGITLSHYRLKLSPFIVMTDLASKKQTLVNPKSLKELVQTLEEYAKLNATAEELGQDGMDVDASSDDEACTQNLC